MAAATALQIPQLAIFDVDASRPQTPVSLSEGEASAPTSPTASRKDSLGVDAPAGWRRRRASSVSTMDTLPMYSGPNSPARSLRDRKRSNSITPSVYSEAPSYRTIPFDNDSTVYHIYRLGHKGAMSVHEVSDASLDLLPRATFADGTPRPLPGFWKRYCLAMNAKTARRPDRPKYDPRMASYFVHKPVLPAYYQHVPMTLRVGPNKHSPIACRFGGNFAWRKWFFDFEDINGEGVVDERGVIATDYPRKPKKVWKPKAPKAPKAETEEAQAVSLKDPKRGSHKRSFSWSPIPKSASKKGSKDSLKGKAIALTVPETKEPDQQPAGDVQETPKIIASAPLRPPPGISVATESEIPDTGESASASTPTPTPSRVTPALTIDTSAGPKPFSPSTQTENPYDRVEMTWENKLGRQYCFTYKDIKFSWKGTSTLSDVTNKKWGAFNRFSHLKLVAELPEDPVQTPKSPFLSPKDAEKQSPLLRRRSSISSLSSISSIFSKKSATKKELLVATYTSVWGKRKAGRLHVDNTAIEKISEAIAAASSSSFVLPSKRRSATFSESQYLSPTCLSPPTRVSHAHVFPTPRIEPLPVEIEIFERKRIKELVVATGIAMANSEQEKRHALVELTALLVEIVQNIPMN
ncbi:hypothetical protein TWF694_000780 [Orbilia ellipsospora]|uniref:Uncharacterized protein n=1 Tax=Orbilia ellipsospora TaxID=2528407 RepID=A0AAV9XQ07_9PEZI